MANIINKVSKELNMHRGEAINLIYHLLNNDELLQKAILCRVESAKNLNELFN